jgi:fatty acid desaturase/nitrite reductase/ring-hydroxylating ferredoxin subunit
MTAVDYSLTGQSRHLAEERGMVNAEWFQPNIDVSTLRVLQERSDTRAAADLVLWVALVVGAGIWAYSTVWSWWSIPAFLIYGALYGGASDPRWHECGHGTAFKTRWVNDLVYPVAAFMLFRGPTVWRWSHFRHHTDTIVVGRDAEISFQRPPSVGRTLFTYLYWKQGTQMFWRLVKHAFGQLDGDAADFVPRSEHRKVIWESRVMVAVVVAAAVWSLVAWTPLPILFVGGPSIYGAWLMVFFGVTQHAGLRENVLDHRYNTRTVYMNPVFRFLYLNMNYHVEHHIFPSVPYRALPKLHAQIKDQLAPPVPNTFAAYRQVFTTMRHQRRDPSYEIPLQVPEVVRAEKHRIEVGVTAWADPSHVAEVAPQVAGDLAAAPAAAPASGIDLGTVDVVAVDQVVRVDVGDRTFVLCRLAEDEYSLLDGICSHERVHLADGLLEDGEIECPKHNGRFDARTGEACGLPATVSICAYPVRRVGDRLIADLGEG